MAEIRIDPTAEGPPAGTVRPAAGAPPAAEPSLGELFKQLAQDSSTLIRQEVALAKAEMRENVRAVGRDVAMIAVGGVLLWIGALVLTAFLVVLLGDLLANYWLAALIIAVLYLAVGAVMVRSNLASLRKNEIKPEQTIDSLKEDKQWIQQEIREAKRELT